MMGLRPLHRIERFDALYGAKRTYLFDSRGQHIANLIGDQLHAPNGRNIGHLMKNQGIFIDMHGHYLGEIIAGNRLMYDRSSGYQSMNFGSYGDYGNAGNYGNPGNAGSIGSIGGHDDVDADWL
jgi:hypothetical protein